MGDSVRTLAGAPRVVVACATFKGTLSSRQAGEAIARGLFQAGINGEVVALADGGEGLVDVLASQVPGALLVGAPCRCPLQTPRTAMFAVLPASGSHRRGTAVIEMAASSGLTLVPEDQRDAKITTTLGVGDQILAALEYQKDGVDVLLGLGGSATNDGGAGMAQALGARFLDVDGYELEPGGAALLKLKHIDISGLDKRLSTTKFTIACDVRSPLCGPQGASYMFGPQKGANPEDVKLLDEALAHFAEVIKKDLGKDVANMPGAGAAGGLGAACLAFLNATLQPGIAIVLDTVNFDARLPGAAYVITGEGCLDDQTLMGKAPAGVSKRARRAGLRCVAIGGDIVRDHEKKLHEFFDGIETLANAAGSADAARLEPARWLEHVARVKGPAWLAG